MAVTRPEMGAVIAKPSRDAISVVSSSRLARSRSISASCPDGAVGVDEYFVFCGIRLGFVRLVLVLRVFLLASGLGGGLAECGLEAGEGVFYAHRRGFGLWFGGGFRVGGGREGPAPLRRGRLP